MKKLLSILSVSLFANLAHAQNPMVTLSNTPIQSLEYLSNTNQYLLNGNISTSTLAGFPNVSPSGYKFPHIALHVLDDNGTNILFKTYCALTETNAVLQHECTSLNVSFYSFDARQTSDGGYIICGGVRRDNETSPCPGVFYDDPFLLKTDILGNVVWYKRYNGATTTLSYFSSVIENEETHGFIVCGSADNGKAFVMGTDPSGVFQWSHAITAYQYDNMSNPLGAAFSKICKYIDPSSQQIYYALTGQVGVENYNAHILSYGGGLLTLIDGNGAVFQNVQFSNDDIIQFMHLNGIADAYDGDVVLTGFTEGSIGGGNCTIGDDYNGNTVTAPLHPSEIVSLKINPLTLTLTYMKSYAPGYRSAGSNVITYANGGNISISGYDAHSYVTYDAGEYLETDVYGNLVRFTNLGNTNTSCGTSITYNTLNGYSLYAGLGNNLSYDGFLVKNKFGNECNSDQSVTITDLTPQVINNDFYDLAVNEIIDQIAAYNLNESQSLVCGKSFYRKSSTTNVNTALKEDDNVTIFPNPSNDFIDVKLPQNMGNTNIKVRNAAGQVVYSQDNITTKTVHINTKSLIPGIYLISIANENKIENSKFVKY